MTAYRVIVQPRARTEALRNFRWKAEQSPQAAARWLSGLQKAVARLAENPYRHPVAVEETERFDIEIRQSLYGKRRGVFRILYHVEDETISVLAIRHSAQETRESLE